MDKHYTLGIYDYDREKICDIYDSEMELIGQAYGIKVTTEINGYHTLEFSIPYVVKQVSINEDLYGKYGSGIYGTSLFGKRELIGDKNYRWDFLRSDYLIRYTCDDQTIWFVANKPTKSRSGKKIYGTVTCSGSESLLKTRNIYMEFDDENGIGTLSYLMQQILNGTGWHFDSTNSDTMYERDGTTEKVRSLKSDGKKGALDLIATVCNLFQARPIFDTENKLVTVKSMNNRVQVLEGVVGNNLSALTINHDSSNICTRLYVEGEYGDYGYVGIDDVIVDGEPWGLPFVVNFDYYRELGVFKQRHETALATYLHDVREVKAEIRANGVLLTESEDAINEMIGYCKLAVYYKSLGMTTPVYVWGDPTAESQVLNVGDEVAILKNNGQYVYESWTGDPTTQLANAYGVAKFITKASGKIGAAEVQIEAKEKEIAQLQRKIDITVKEDKKAEYRAEIQRIQGEITVIYNGDESTVGLYTMMDNVMKNNGLFSQYVTYLDRNDTLNTEQDDIEATFIVAMGYMLRDGYWSNQNYTVGQEQYLYDDAIDMANEMGKPETSYTFSYVRVTEDFDIPAEEIDVNAIFKLYDQEMNVDDKLFIKKITFGVDDKSLGSIEVSNQDITLTGNDLGSLLSRMSQLADLIEQKNALYERAKALTSDGSLYTRRLNGQIDVLKTQLLSTVSNWFTDDNGNIMFLSADGGSAMMLCGAGFMIADGKDNSGEWNWRTFGTGHGFTADEIVAGFISADRIEAGTIAVSKLEPGVGSELDISGNPTVTTLSGDIDDVETIANNIANGTTAVPNVDSTGISINGNYLQLKTTGEMQILGNGKVYIGSSSSNSAVVIDKNGIAIGSNKSISIASGSKITLAAASGLQIGTGTGATTLADYATISMVPTSISALTFDTFGNSGKVQISPTKITVGSSGSIDLSAAGSISLKAGCVTLNSLETSVKNTVNKAAGITVDSSGKIVLSALSSSVQNTLNNSVSQSDLSSTLSNYATISIVPTKISALTFDTFGNSSQIQIAPTSIVVGSSGSININSGNTTNISLTNNGIELAGGKYIKIKSGNNVAIQLDSTGIDMQTAGKFYLHAQDSSGSAIIFGTNASSASFSVGQTGEVVCKSLTVDDLTVNGNGLPRFVISETTPSSGSNIVWIKPSSTTEKTWSFRPSSLVLDSTGGTLGYYKDFYCEYSAADYLSGSLFYGIVARLQFYSAMGYENHTFKARLQNGSSWIDIGSVTQTVTQWGTLRLDTMTSAATTNVMSVGGGSFKIRLETTASSAKCMLLNEDIQFKAKTTSSGGYSSCSVFYKS